MDKAAFLQRYAAIYEHSPWIAEAAYAAFGDAGIDALHRAMKDAVANGGRERQLALIRAHPDLACAPAVKLTQESTSEQAGAGLKDCTPEEYAEFQALNAAYKAKFGFPFIVAVKGLTRHDILKMFRARIDNTAEEEFRMALEQINRIAWFRLQALK